MSLSTTPSLCYYLVMSFSPSFPPWSLPCAIFLPSPPMQGSSCRFLSRDVRSKSVLLGCSLLCTREQMAELIEAAAELATSTKYVTSYKYFNTALRNEQSTGIVYLEDDTKMVIYQSKDHITPWHGSWTYEENILKIIFDPNAGKPDLWQDGGISLQSTCALKTGRTGSAQDHLYEGRDYMLREILITPITRWVLRTGSDTWVRIADYSEISHEWVFREALR